MRKLKIKDVGKVVSGSTPKTNIDSYWGGDIPWVTPKELSSLDSQYLSDSVEKITEEGFKSCSTTMLPKNSVLFSSRAPIGLIAINKIPVCTNQGFKSVIPNKNVSTLYLYYTLKFFAKRLDSLGNGATFRELSKKTFEEFEIPIPENIEDQIRIANILSKAEALISQRKESLRLLDELLKSTFLEMFGDPVRNEKKFDRRKLKDVCIRITDGTHFSPPIIEEGFPYITAKHVRENKIDFWSKPWFISEKDHKEIYKRCDPKPGDVLYIKDGATTGYAAINKYDFEFSMLSSLALLRTDKSICNSEYLCSWLNNPIVKKKILEGMSGGAIQRLTLTKINELPINLPPLKLQAQFAHIVGKTEALKAYYQTSLQELENLYGSLSQRAFKRELSLKGEELAMAAEPEVKYKKRSQ